MALTEAQIQKKALKQKGVKDGARLDRACFGQPAGMADGGYVQTEQTPEQARGAEIARNAFDTGETRNVGNPNTGVALGTQHDDLRASGLFGLSATQGGLVSRPQSALQQVNPGDLVAMQRTPTPGVSAFGDIPRPPQPGSTTGTTGHFSDAAYGRAHGMQESSGSPSIPPPNGITFGGLPQKLPQSPIAAPGPTPAQAQGIAQTLAQYPAPSTSTGQLPRGQLPRNQLSTLGSTRVYNQRAPDPIIKARSVYGYGNGLADGGLVGDATKTIQTRKQQLDDQEAKALGAVVVPPKPQPAQPAPKPVEEPRPFMKTLKKAFGFADGGEVDAKKFTVPLPIPLPDDLAASMKKTGRVAIGAAMMLHSKEAGRGSDEVRDVETGEKLNTEGRKKKFGRGGLVQGPGTGTSDSINAKLSRHEFVLPADTTAAIGVDKLEEIVAATHTPVKAQFGNGLVNGTPPGWDSTWEGKSIGNPRVRPAPVDFSPTNQATRAVNNPGLASQPQPKVDIGSKLGTPAPEGYSRGMATPSASAPAPGQGLLAEAAAEAPKPKGFWNSVKNAPSNINQKGVGGLGKLIKGGLALGAASGLFDSATESDASRNQFNEQSGIEGDGFGSDLARNAARVATRVGDASSFGYASKIGRGLAGAVGADEGKRMEGFATGFDQPSARPTTSASGSGGAAVTPQVTTPAAKSALQQWQEKQIAAGYADQGDYGVPGQHIFGKSNRPDGRLNDFVGIGTGGRPASNGIDFGLNRMGAYGGGNEMKLPTPPEFQDDPEAIKADQRVAELGSQLEAMRGKIGSGALRRELANQISVASALRARSTAQNAHAQTSFQNQNAAFGHVLAYGTADASNRLEREKANLGWQKDMAGINLEKHKLLVSESDKRLGQSRDLLDNMAGGDKALGDMLKVFAATRTFPDGKGNEKLWHDLSPEARQKIIPALKVQAMQAQSALGNDDQYSLTGADRYQSAGVADWVHSFVKHPINSIMKPVVTVNGKFGTAQPLPAQTHEEADLIRRQLKDRQ